jgi:hypothetical protein
MKSKLLQKKSYGVKQSSEVIDGNDLSRKSCLWSSRETGCWHNPRQTTARIDSHGRLKSSTEQPINNLECLPNGNDSLETVAY